MNGNELPDQEPRGAAASGEAAPQSKAKRRATAALRRELNEKELSSSTAQKFLLDEIDRLDEENSSLSSYRAMFHEADKKSAVLEQKAKVIVSQEIVATASLTVGSAALGYAPSIWATQPNALIALAFGVLLVGLGVLAKVVRS